MSVELLCVDVDGTMTDGKLFYGVVGLNSSLGTPCGDLGNFEHCADFSPVLHSKFPKNSATSTANTRICDLDSVNQAKSAESTLDSANSQNLGENSVKSAESTLDSTNFADSALSTQEANSSIFDEKSGLCSCEREDRTISSSTRAGNKLPDLSQKDAEFAEILKVFNAKDGLALAYWCKSLKRKTAIITGKKSEILRHRAKELGIEFLFMGVKDKGKVVRGLKKDLALDSAQVACVGDDLNDISMFAESSLNFAPRDCASHLKTLPNIEILRCKGGRGAVREAIEIILQKEGIYEDFTSFFTR